MDHRTTPSTDGNNSQDVAHRTETRLAELLRTKQDVRDAWQRAQQVSSETQQLVDAFKQRLQEHRKWRLAALNLIEDAVLARTQAQASNAELRVEIGERQRAEVSLSESEQRLQSTVEQLQQLNAEFERRVHERTRDLQQREAQLRELTAQLQRVEQKERQRLARRLHDQVQQLLFTAKLRAEVLVSDVPDAERPALSAVVALLVEAIDATRNLAVELAPPLLHDQGLPAALRWLIARTNKEHGVNIQGQISPAADPQSEELRDILFQAAQEFLLNAVKHAQARDVTLQLAQSRARIRLSVRDRGPGIAPSRRTDGFGLLQLRQRLQVIGGRLLFRSAPDQGTCATAEAPAARAIVSGSDTRDVSRNGDAGAVPRPLIRNTSAAAADRITVVLIDDQQIVRDGLRELLNRHADIEVVAEAANGALGVDAVFETQPRVAIMDVQMPVLNGIEATRRILAEFPETRIIGLSAEASPEGFRSMREAGAVMYLTKDEASSRLVQAIRDAVAQPSP